MNEGRKLLLIFIALFLCVFLPTYASVPFEQQETMLVIRDVFLQTSVAFLWLSPLIHVATIMLIVAIFRYGRRAGRIADAYFGNLFLFLAFSNHIAITENYGLVVITGNVVQIVFVGLFWLWDVSRQQNVFVFQSLPVWRYWVIIPAALAFWSPINADLSPNFSPLLLLTSSFGVMFCSTTPVVIALLTLIYPNVNKYVLAVTSFVGFLIGIFNAISLFIMPGYSVWNFVLHLPLILISLYGLLIAKISRTIVYRKRKTMRLILSTFQSNHYLSNNTALRLLPILCSHPSARAQMGDKVERYKFGAR